MAEEENAMDADLQESEEGTGQAANGFEPDYKALYEQSQTELGLITSQNDTAPKQCVRSVRSNTV